MTSNLDMAKERLAAAQQAYRTAESNLIMAEREVRAARFHDGYAQMWERHRTEKSAKPTSPVSEYDGKAKP